MLPNRTGSFGPPAQSGGGARTPSRGSSRTPASTPRRTPAQGPGRAVRPGGPGSTNTPSSGGNRAISPMSRSPRPQVGQIGLDPMHRERIRKFEKGKKDYEEDARKRKAERDRAMDDTTKTRKRAEETREKQAEKSKVRSLVADKSRLKLAAESDLRKSVAERRTAEGLFSDGKKRVSDLDRKIKNAVKTVRKTKIQNSRDFKKWELKKKTFDEIDEKSKHADAKYESLKKQVADAKRHADTLKLEKRTKKLPPGADRKLMQATNSLELQVRELDVMEDNLEAEEKALRMSEDEIVKAEEAEREQEEILEEAKDDLRDAREALSKIDRMTA